MCTILLLLFLPLSAAWAQAGFIGTWTGVVDTEDVGVDEVEIQFKEDGVLVYIQKVTLDDEGSEPVELALEGTGTWRTAGENIWLEVTEIVLDDHTLALLTEFAKGIARAVADILGISDEDYPAFEADAVAEFMAEFEQTAEGVTASGTFAVEGHTLTLEMTDEEGSHYTFELQRKLTAVRKISWGQIKLSRN